MRDYHPMQSFHALAGDAAPRPPAWRLSTVNTGTSGARRSLLWCCSPTPAPASDRYSIRQCGSRDRPAVCWPWLSGHSTRWTPDDGQTSSASSAATTISTKPRSLFSACLATWNRPATRLSASSASGPFYPRLTTPGHHLPVGTGQMLAMEAAPWSVRRVCTRRHRMSP